jgi:hypothetical protein
MQRSSSLGSLIERLQERGLSDAEIVAAVKQILHETGHLVGREARHRGFSAGTPRRTRDMRAPVSSTRA